ncbi:MAG TPA: class I SAM-dependent methyltransferase [Polyangiales bacterium]|nr:class I SAM-dependent methyltransferase [Polyangiales bacterium]
MRQSYAQINSSKANFDQIYTQADPRSYFSALGALDYMIPDLAAPILNQLLSARAARNERPRKVLDVGCSYGINAAMHRYPLNFSTLRRRYTRHEITQLNAQALRHFDRLYYSSWPDVGQAAFIGLDSSRSAIEYARAVGLIEHGIVADLERDPLSPQDAEIVQQADVIMSTGCIGYVTDRTYQTLLGAMDHKPWVISFVLRMFPYESMARVLAQHGLVTERLAGATFAQRRFRDEEEFEHTLRVLRTLGISTEGVEAHGLFYAELYVSRPEADVRAAPLSKIVTACSGQQRPVGPRFVMVDAATPQIVLEP